MMRTLGFSSRTRIYLATSALVLLAASTGFAILLFARSGNNLIIAPNKIADLTSKMYQTGTPVSATFRLVNPAGKPVLVKGYATSCSCVASEVEGGKAPPFLLGPGESAEFIVRTILQPRREPVQTFRVVIESECEGKPLPELTAAMLVRVEDGLMSLPESITAVNLPFERSQCPEVFLFTHSAVNSLRKPTLVVSDPEVIKAAVVEKTSSILDKDRFKTHYAIQTTLVPKAGRSSFTGWIKVLVGDRLISNIPIRCSFKQPYRLSQDAVEIRGRVGETVTQTVYYEAADPSWNGIASISTPRDVQVHIEPFDKTSDVIKVTAKVFSKDQQISVDANERLEFAVSDTKQRITIPISYVIDE
jgi:hypothetical protein